MSAFLQSDKAYNSIAWTLIRLTTAGDWRVKRLAEEIISVISKTRTAPADVPAYNINGWIIKRWSEDLQRANVVSVNYRYNENDASAYKCDPLKGRELLPVELVKLLHSVNYQSCEPEHWDREPIAKELREVTQALEAHVVRESSAYEKAAWSM